MKFELLIWPLLCTALIGAMMGIGGGLAVSGKKPTKKTLSSGMGFFAGMLVYLSIFDVIPQSVSYLEKAAAGRDAVLTALGISALTAIVSAAFIRLYPGRDIHKEHAQAHTICEASKIYKSGLFAFLAVSLLNLFKGAAVFMTASDNPVSALPMVFSMMMNNIVFGIIIAVSVFLATDDRKRAAGTTLRGGLFPPLGAALVAIALELGYAAAIIGAGYAVAGGLMISASVCELYPASKKYEPAGHTSIVSALCGMALSMAILAFFG